MYNPIEADKKIYQLDQKGDIVGVYYNVLEIATLFNVSRTRFDQAIRLGYKASDFFWILKSDYDLGKRPDLTRQKRNMDVYAYNPHLKKIKEAIDGNEAEFEFVYEKFTFIGRYYSSIIAGKVLDISSTNIRKVLNKKISLHRGYWFNYAPLLPEHNYIANMKEAYDRNLHIKTREGKGIFTKANIYPKFYFIIKIFKNEELNTEEKLIEINSIEEIRNIVLEIIDPINRLQQRKNLNVDFF